MSQGTICHRHERSNYRLAHVRHNHSAFSGYHRTYSDYSSVVCVAPDPTSSNPHNVCSHRWNSKAAWVDNLPHLSPADGYAMKETCL